MSEQAEKIVQTYKKLAEIPSLISAQIVSGNVVYSTWLQRNVETGKYTKFIETHFLSSELRILGDALPLDTSNELLSSISPIHKLRAVIKEINDIEYLEIWNGKHLKRCIDLNATKAHGKVYTDGEFVTFEWSPNESKILYIAEEKSLVSEPFYKRQPFETNEEKTTVAKGEEYLFKENWGDGLSGKVQSVLVEYNITDDCIQILKGTPKNICPAQAIYSPDGNYIVGVGYKATPRKLGLLLRTNRPTVLFKLDFEGDYEEISSADYSVRSPRFSLDGETLVWLQRKVGGTPAGALQLVKTSSPPTNDSTIEVIIDVVQSEAEIAERSAFYGLYNSSLPKKCWASDNRLLLSTVQKYEIKTYVVDIDSETITELKYESGSQTVLDVFDDIIVANRSNLLTPDKLVIAKLPEKGEESSIEWQDITEPLQIEKLQLLHYNFLELTSSNTSDEIRTFTTIYIGPETGEEKETPLIVSPHGGPHSAFVNKFSIDVALLVMLDYAVVLVNYRGSIGAGQDNVEFLLGRIGKTDVADCILATVQSYIQYPWIDPNRTVLIGGSHGGFLVAHLSAQYPDMFKAVVARNPIVDIPSMGIGSDIPDWCYTETGHDFTQIGEPDIETFIRMKKVSPIQCLHKIKAPTLLLVGSKDLRVPYSQSMEYYYRLKANGTPVRMNMYDDEHPLAKLKSEMDHLIHTVLWIKQYTSEVVESE